MKFVYFYRVWYKGSIENKEKRVKNMGIIEYQEALKLGKKEYKGCISKGRFPYLPVLDEILSHEQIQTEQPMGIIHIPLEYVVGTCTVGRTQAFASNFMPILDYGTEFSVKWAALSDAQVSEGIRDPIVAYEYRNRYYVVEGNKRVSVLKYYKADSVPAVVTRKVPKLTEDEDIKLYYEYMKFNEVTTLNTVEFTRLGNAEKLLDSVGKKDKWDDETIEEFNRVLLHFTKAYRFHGGGKLPITVGDALVSFLNVFDYESLTAMSDRELKDNIIKSWSEFVVQTRKDNVDLVMDPANTTERRNLFSYFLPSSAKRLNVAFLYPGNPETSDWIYGHELGRAYLEEMFSEQIHTSFVNDVKESNIKEVLEEVIGQGANIIFGIGPQMMKPCLKAAVEHPEVKILNCSLNTPHRYIRTYYARMYEAKFLSGIIAGAMTENDRIGYVADYPIFGMTANINAFALGAACVNPRAKIYLEWSTKKGYDLGKFLWENQIYYVSNQDMITPSNASREFGVYKLEDGKTVNLVMPVWNWGIFYEKLIQSILAGYYKSEESSEPKALNYWWGMSAGVIDLIYSNKVPKSVQKLAEHLQNDICKGDATPFYGEIYAQDGSLKNKQGEYMKPEDIMTMDWLVENVIGSIPVIDELVDNAQTVVALKGVEEAKQG